MTMMQNLGTRLKYTEQYCMSNNLSQLTWFQALQFHSCIQARESKGTTRIQAAKPKPLTCFELKRSHDRQKLAGGLRGGIDMQPRMR